MERDRAQVIADNLQNISRRRFWQRTAVTIAGVALATDFGIVGYYADKVIKLSKAEEKVDREHPPVSSDNLSRAQLIKQQQDQYHDMPKRLTDFADQTQEQNRTHEVAVAQVEKTLFPNWVREVTLVPATAVGGGVAMFAAYIYTKIGSKIRVLENQKAISKETDGETFATQHKVSLV